MIEVGIVMPVYKQKREYLSAAIKSILNQTFKQFRFIIVIDGDTEMLKLSKQLVGGDPRVEFVVNEVNLGVAKALNRGFEVLFADSRMKYVTWVSSDNIYYPQFISVLRHALARCPEEIGLVYSSFCTIDGEDRSLDTEQTLALLRQYQSQPREALLDACITGVSFMYKSKYAKQIEGYYLEPVEDYEYWLRLTELCDIKYIPVELVDYRVNSTFSISATLQTTDNHRKWRYAYHLARYEARMRRGIAPLVTVLFSVKQLDEQGIACLESLYEQSFSNYELHILDCSSDRAATYEISKIAHPAVTYKFFPQVDEEKAIFYASQFTKTPLTFVLGKESLPQHLQMETLVRELSTKAPDYMSNYFTKDNLIGYRKYENDDKSYFNELFRTVHFFAYQIKKHLV
ncbi:glycosyltransferase family 2 protein [Paenibacillus alba]|uniref:Glycosyltransferase n=1 Tax=Paenibacillus alba TaxID=1197127 RepID=A0ABU6GDD9_9BACL|nr:glycosyltransferase [Paenibacillus alba]MEC0232223.1 glycosyltransferase [Paenibacillus alba]